MSAKRCKRVIVQTKWMKDAVAEDCKLSKEKILQIPPNVENLSHLRNNAVFCKENFFYPTAKAIYKNNDCIYKACEILEKEKCDFNVTLTLPKEKSTKGINCIGRIPYEEVIDYYNKSTLIFPSYIETFGYPLVEARKLGAIVLASDCAFSREALEGYENAYFFNPFKPEELASLMKKVISGEIERKETESFLAPLQDNWKNIMNEVIALAE